MLLAPLSGWKQKGGLARQQRFGCQRAGGAACASANLTQLYIRVREKSMGQLSVSCGSGAHVPRVQQTFSQPRASAAPPYVAGSPSDGVTSKQTARRNTQEARFTRREAVRDRAWRFNARSA